MENINRKTSNVSACNLICISCILCFFISCNLSQDTFYKGKFIGTFALDISKSKMGWYLSDSLTYKNLELSLLQNDSFYFSIDAPFIRKNKGKWEVRSIDGLNYAFLNYDTTEYAVIDDKINFTLGGSIYFHSLRSKNGQPVIEYAFFKRVK